METENLPNVGDVITSKKFAFGYYDEQRTVITVDGTTTSHPVTSFLDNDERLELAATSGQIPPEKETVEFGAYDPSRAKAKFVVEEAGMQGGGHSGRGDGDYPDGWHVKARRLNNDDSYDPNGEVICFYMSGCFNGVIKPTNVRVVGKMRLHFVWDK